MSPNKSNCAGFSLAEVLAALTIGAMVLIAVISVYNRTQSCAASISRNLDNERYASEILQQIAQDLDGIIDTGRNVRISLANKTESHGFRSARLSIIKTIFNDQMRASYLKKIDWQTNYDYDGSNKLILYRNRSGLAPEDKLLEREDENPETAVFIPVCQGLTYFAVEIPQGDQMRDSWISDKLPEGLRITISFAEPVKNAAGILEVPDTEKTSRTIAIDRTRKLQFTYTPPDSNDPNKPAVEDPNKIQKVNDPNKSSNNK